MSFGQEDLIKNDILAFLDQHENKELLRFVAVGSVDDGKSTLIGRLLHDAKGVYEDQLQDATSQQGDGETAIDFARITDGLQAEREQGITIDVAYRYFSTPKRKFIIADTPGHVQYTRNMVTGASTADVAVTLIDARHGVLRQSRRHAYIANLLGIKHLLVCVNKMDLKDYDQQVFDDIRAEFSAFAENLDFADVTYIPISALHGINIIEKSDLTPWYNGPSVIGFLETVDIAGDRNYSDFRLPIQYVLRPNLDYRGFSGQIVSGVVKKGDKITVLPSGTTSTVKAIDTYTGELEEACAPLSVTLRLNDEIDISRGDIIVPSDNLPIVARRLEAHVVWMSETPLDPRRSYVIKHNTRYVRTDFNEIKYRVDLETLEHNDAEQLALNDIGRVVMTTHRPIVFDAYTRNRGTGAFIIIDAATNNTVAAGMLISEAQALEVEEHERTSQVSNVAHRERSAILGQRPIAFWLRGGSDAQRTEVAAHLERMLIDRRHLAVILDGSDLLSDAGKSLVDSEANIGALARRLCDAGVITLITHAVDAESKLDAARNELPKGLFGQITLVDGATTSGASGPNVLDLQIDIEKQDTIHAAREILSTLIDQRVLDDDR